MNRPPSSVFHAITVVWGREYLDLFLNTCLPNQLGDGNVAALPPGSRYRIMTRAQHVAEVQAHSSVRSMADLIHVDVIAMDALEAVDAPDPTRRRDRRFELLTVCHRRAIGDALEAGAALLFLSPDIIMSAGTFASIVDRHRAGARAVVCTGLRLNKQPFLQALDDEKGNGAAPAPRALVRMALAHLHGHTRSMFVDARAFSTFPVGIYWPVGAQGLLARCLHLHPLMVDPTRWDVLPKGTVDADYLARTCPDPADVHVVTDSDEFALFELTDADLLRVGTTRSVSQGMSVWRATVVAAHCDDLQIEYWRRHPVRIHVADLDDRWTAVEATAEAFVRAVLWRCRPFGVRAPRWFQFLERTRQLYDRHRRSLRRRLPRVTLKQVVRPMRLARSRAGKALRKTRRLWLGRRGAYSR